MINNDFSQKLITFLCTSHIRPGPEFSGHVEAQFIIVIIGIFRQFYCQLTGKISKIARVHDTNFEI